MASTDEDATPQTAATAAADAASVTTEAHEHPEDIQTKPLDPVDVTNAVHCRRNRRIADSQDRTICTATTRSRSSHFKAADDGPSLHLRRQGVTCRAATLWDSIEWMASAGAQVDAGQRLGTAGRLEDGTLRVLQAPCKGKLHFLTKEQSDEMMVAQGDKGARSMRRTVAVVEYCVHPVRNGRTCLMCLEVVDDEEDEGGGSRGDYGDGDGGRETGGSASVNVVSHGQVIRLNLEEAKKFDTDNIRRQLGAKKLSLVLDLDHTLLHAVRVDDVEGKIATTDDIHFFFISGLDQQHVVKLRPGLTEFLTELSALYDLFIYTHGTRLYAEEIVKIIDPDETYFKNRVVARTDTPDMFHKSLKLLFPSCDDSMILVLDDRIDVWKDNEANVFLIEPYHYFKCTAEINNASGRGVADQHDAEATEDGYLAQAVAILTDVHNAFYEGHGTGMRGTTVENQMAGNGRDVKAILSERKRAILHGCSIVFSGVFPIVGPRSHGSHHLWRLSVDLGAVPSVTLKDFPMTHLVIHPERLGTEKHAQAKLLPEVLIVTPDWILKCARTWSRVSEQDFLADEWQAKYARKESAEQEVKANVSAEADIPSETPSGTCVTTGGDVSANEPSAAVSLASEDKSASTIIKDQELGEPSAAVSLASEDKSASTIIKDQELGEAKRGKQVTFADDVANPPSDDGTEKKPGAVRRSRVVRRSPGAGRARTANAASIATGVVATGGTFDFLSKISAIKRESATSVKVQKAKVTTKDRARPVSPPKDVDDAFLRLIEAEEREIEEEKKRKRSSTEIKDQLFTRRAKKNTSKHARDPDSDAIKAAEKRMRVTSPEQSNGAIEDDSEDEELDDLEADILGDL
uniref:RNA polymerase II subunit A C-terminal domain phosphatase n=1 Tax=Peronospora matthiolae TaxID=2874970 RepID=A0AAV1UI70_9STRA